MPEYVISVQLPGIQSEVAIRSKDDYDALLRRIIQAIEVGKTICFERADYGTIAFSFIRGCVFSLLTKKDAEKLAHEMEKQAMHQAAMMQSGLLVPQSGGRGHA
jgi:hypothetical protein